MAPDTVPTRFVTGVWLSDSFCVLGIAAAPNVHGPRALREKHLVADCRIDKVAEGLSSDIAVDVLRDECLDPFLTSWRSSSHVGCDDEIGHIPEITFGRQRFFLNHVESSSAQRSLAQGEG